MRLMPKVNKLLLALQLRNVIYLFGSMQVWSKTFSKTVTVYKLDRRYTAEEYKKLYPRWKPKKRETEYKTVTELRTPKLIEVLLFLSDRYKEVREHD